MKHFTITSLIATVLLASALPGAAAMRMRATELRGTVASATHSSLVIATQSGAKTVFFAPKMRFFGIADSSLSKVTANSFIGTTVVPQADGTYRSTEVHIFAPSLRGTGEGFTKMDSRGKHMMANATVKTVKRPSNMMANSTVRSVGSSSAGKDITMVFKSGTKHITIPANTRVVEIDPGSTAMLMHGAHVVAVVMSMNGRLIARTLIVGEHGIVPPT